MFMHKQHWLQSRDAAARWIQLRAMIDDGSTDMCLAPMQLQRAFRGWRTRRRVVHQVREDMELLVADIRHQLDGDWALLGPAAASSFLLDWGADDKLRLPRMEDAVFGVSVRFPDKEEGHDDANVADANVDEQVANLDSEQEATNAPDTAAVIAPLESGLDYQDQVSSTFENRPQPADESAADQAVGQQETNTAHEISSDTSTCDARVSAVEIRSNSLQAETSAELQVNRALQQTDNDGKSQLASVQEILATHSRAEILLEIEWARQALRDRRKYLRFKRRVERNSDMILA